MPHDRKRHLTPIVANYLKASPIVGVIGHRQTGKTTLCSHFAKELASLDREADLILCEQGPTNFIKNRSVPFMIDECQLSPRLFPAMKEHARLNKKPGQFLLTGSVRFSGRKAIRESLTGRILLAELLPMTWSECNSKPINDLLITMHKKGVANFPIQSRPRVSSDQSTILRYLELGGLPGICFTRSQSQRIARFKTHLDTLIDRDLRLIIETTLPKMTLISLIATMARYQGTQLSWEFLRRETGISALTIKRLFSAFEALFLLRPVSMIERAVSDTYYFEDAGLATYLAGWHHGAITLPGFTHFLFCNLREAFHYNLGSSYSIHTYRTPGGAYVPLVFSAFNRHTAILPILEREPTLSSLRSAESFLKKHQGNQAIIVHFGTEARALHSRLAAIPWNWLI